MNKSLVLEILQPVSYELRFWPPVLMKYLWANNAVRIFAIRCICGMVILLQRFQRILKIDMNEPTRPIAEASEQKAENPLQSKLKGEEQLAQSHQEQIISAQANSTNAIELPKQVRPLKFRFVWAYWTLLVGAACTCLAAMAYLHAHAANAIVVFCLWGGVFVSITALNNLIWLNKVKRSFSVVNFKDIEVTWLLHTNSFNKGFRVEAIINRHLVVPISESINEFDKSVFNDLSTSPQSTRRALFIPGSSVPALIDTGNHYIWLKVPSGMTTIWKAAILSLLLCWIGIHW